MTHENAGHYAGKHAPGETPDPGIAEAATGRAKQGALACAVAFEIAEEQGASPAAVGKTLDLLEIKIVGCQLGLFGRGHGDKSVPPMEQVPADLEASIRDRLRDGCLSCAAAWEIAAEKDLPKRGVSAAADKLGIHIRPCQLGVF